MDMGREECKEATLRCVVFAGILHVEFSLLVVRYMFCVHLHSVTLW